MNREQHLQWAKDRALMYIEDGDTANAFASMTSDLMKHDELKTHAAIGMGMALTMGGGLSSPVQMRDFINGFN